MGTDFFDDDLGQRRSANKTNTLVASTEGVGNTKSDDAPVRPISDLNLTRMARHREEVNAQMASAKLQIERLKQRQTDMEREKHMLEDLLQKQEHYEHGKQEMIDRLTESIISLQKLGEHAARQVEIYWATRERFAAALDELQNINDAEWTDDVFRDELNKAVARVDGIRGDYVKSQATIEAVGGPIKLFDESSSKQEPEAECDPRNARDFLYWLKMGFAFSLPVVITILIAMGILLAQH